MLRTSGALLHVEKCSTAIRAAGATRRRSSSVRPAVVRQHGSERPARAVSEKIKGVQWIPDWGQARIESMVANRPDWCISRQRTWGVPMSLFVHKETHELHPNTPELMEEVAKRVEVDGIQAWWDLDARDIWARTRTTRKCQTPGRVVRLRVDSRLRS